MYDRSFGRNDQKSSDLFKKIKFEIRDSICNLWDRIWKNARMLALFTRRIAVDADSLPRHTARRKSAPYTADVPRPEHPPMPCSAR